MCLAFLVKLIQFIIAPLMGALTAGVVFGQVGILACAMVWVVDEILIYSNITSKHCLTHAIVETAIGSMIGIQVQELIDRKVMDYVNLEPAKR
jgi:hypothetical protein